MAFHQQKIVLLAKPRGFHLVTQEICSQLDLSSTEAGMLHLFLQHTSASLSINENASPEVRRDFEKFFRRLVPDESTYFEHTLEGLDDMPAHIKVSLLGSALSIPIQKGCLLLGRWQGIYLGEHREYGGQRQLIASIYS